MSLINPPKPDPPPITSDQQVHIYCPDCDYDVTGQTENRCPECGQPFDPNRLFLWSTGHDLPPTFGPKNDIGYITLVMMALFQPSRLARHLQPNPSSLFWYSMALRLIATASVPALLSPIPFTLKFSEGLMFILVLQLPVLISSLACEWIIAALLGKFVQPRSVRAGEGLRFWLTACYCSTVFLAMSSTLIALLFTIMYALSKLHVDSH